MITQLEIKLKSENSSVNILYGNLLQGYLMSKISADYAERMHNLPLNPYSQYVYFDAEHKNFVWRISALNEEADNEIIQKIAASNDSTIFLEHSGIILSVLSKEIIRTSYKEISDKYFLPPEPKRRIKICTLTPATYKSNNEYQIFPEVRSIYISLFNKWNAFNIKVNLNSKEALEHLINYTKLESYSLKSAKFETDGIRINCFKGVFSLYVKGPAPLVNIANMLFDYAQYAGLGAKTSIGMGGVLVD